MDVLARYCSIPGYNKLCCDSCRKRGAALSLFSDAAETEEHVRFGSASQLLETMTAAAANGTRSAKQKSAGKSPAVSGDVAKHTTTPAPTKKTQSKVSTTPRRVPRHVGLTGRKLFVASPASLAEVRGSSSLTDSRWSTAHSEVER